MGGHSEKIGRLCQSHAPVPVPKRETILVGCVCDHQCMCVCVSLRYDMAMDQKPVALLNQCSWQMGAHHSKYGVVGF